MGKDGIIGLALLAGAGYLAWRSFGSRTTSGSSQPSGGVPTAPAHNLDPGTHLPLPASPTPQQLPGSQPIDVRSGSVYSGPVNVFSPMGAAYSTLQQTVTAATVPSGLDPERVRNLAFAVSGQMAVYPAGAEQFLKNAIQMGFTPKEIMAAGQQVGLNIVL